MYLSSLALSSSILSLKLSCSAAVSSSAALFAWSIFIYRSCWSLSWDSKIIFGIDWNCVSSTLIFSVFELVCSAIMLLAFENYRRVSWSCSYLSSTVLLTDSASVFLILNTSFSNTSCLSVNYSSLLRQESIFWLILSFVIVVFGFSFFCLSLETLFWAWFVSIDLFYFSGSLFVLVPSSVWENWHP